jgi:hypothetical protein
VKTGLDDVDVIGMQFFDPVRKLTSCVEVTVTSRSEVSVYIVIQSPVEYAILLES